MASDKNYRYEDFELKEIFNNIQNKNKILIIGEQGIGDEVFFSDLYPIYK